MSTKPRNAKLQLRTVSTNGKWAPAGKRGAVYVTCTGKDNRTDQMAVQVPYNSSIDGPAKESEDALINITFEGGKTWSGTFADLAAMQRFVEDCRYLCQAPDSDYKACVNYLMEEARKIVKG